MKDLRESGQIENEAHCTLRFYGAAYDKEQGHHLTNGKVLVPKNRFLGSPACGQHGVQYRHRNIRVRDYGMQGNGGTGIRREASAGDVQEI